MLKLSKRLKSRSLSVFDEDKKAKKLIILSEQVYITTVNTWHTLTLGLNV